MVTLRFIAIYTVMALLPFSAHAQESSPSPQLHRGINLSSWLANAPRQPAFARDFDQIKRAGFDHVRLPFNPQYYGFSLSSDTVTTPVDFTALDRAISMADQAGLPVILDMHPSGDFVDTVERHAWAENEFVTLWQTIAEHYKTRSSATLIFELLNEPQYYKSEALWVKLAARTQAAIRKVSPDRTIIIGAPHGSSIDGLNFLEPTGDPNTIYAFHFYEPYLVTHQGIHMGFEKQMIRYFRAMPYPSSLATQPATTYAPDATNLRLADHELLEYINTPWDAQHVKSRIDAARDWAAQHHVRVICGEFGVLRNHIDPDSRYRWINDARAAMDEDGIGWELWDYADLFGIVKQIGETSTDPVDGSVRLENPEKGSRVFEAQAITALGLKAGVK